MPFSIFEYYEILKVINYIRKINGKKKTTKQPHSITEQFLGVTLRLSWRLG